MPGKRLSLDLRERVIKAWKDSETAKEAGDKKNVKSFPEIGRQLYISKSTVKNIINKFKNTGSIEDIKVDGRPRKTSERDDRKIVLAVNRNSFVVQK